MTNPNDLMRVTLMYREDNNDNDTTTVVRPEHLLALIECCLTEIYESEIEGLKPRPTAEQALAEAQIDGWHGQLAGQFCYESYHLFVRPLIVWQPAP